MQLGHQQDGGGSDAEARSMEGMGTRRAGPEFDQLS
jgi:hypothetical protein